MGQELQVSYFETLDKFHTSCLEAVEHLFELLPGVQRPEVWPCRENEVLQSGTDCALHVMHYVEARVREAQGDGAGCGCVPGYMAHQGHQGYAGSAHRRPE